MEQSQFFFVFVFFEVFPFISNQPIPELVPQLEMMALSPLGPGRDKDTRVPSRMGLVARGEGLRG